MSSEVGGGIGNTADGAARGRTGWRIWLPVGLLLYAAFIILCFYMESEGRSRFRVPSRADIATIEDPTSRIRAEGAHGRALAEMRAWQPYSAYSVGWGVVVLGGTAFATFLGARVVWRGVRRDSVGRASYVVVGMLLIAVASLFLLALPKIVAEQRLDSKRTTHVSGP